jgi:hypothetical protein
MARKKPHIGSSFDSWLDEAGIREDVAAGAIKAVIARQLASEMKKKITKQRMALLMKTSRAQLDRLLDLTTAAPRSKACSARQDRGTRIAAAVGVGLSAMTIRVRPEGHLARRVS